MKTRILSKICGIAMMIPLTTFAQNNINGTVQNELHEPIIAAKVVIENTFLSATTNPDGEFEIRNVKDGDYVISITAYGYETLSKEVTLSNNQTLNLQFEMKESPQMVKEMLVLAVRADDKTPTTYSNIKNKEIQEKNFGQDLPYLLNTLPSTVVTSDAGAGVGYTGIRIRGVDPTRTNVTINGIPVNDSESHGVYWVNMPDFASSVDNIQVQRGVGTSSNGASAFGASINIKTDNIKRKAYGSVDNSYGSFNTWKNSIKAGTGLINEKFTIDTRLSRISSAGYLDRAESNLTSYYLSGSWMGKKSHLRATVFSGREKTYQAWWGVPGAKLSGDKDSLTAHFYNNYYPGGMYQTAADSANLFDSDPRTYNYYTYENEVDNYKQDHYQLHFNRWFKHSIKLSAALHYTRGAGYYEQYKINQDFSTYSFAPIVLSSDTITTTDIIRRRWLDNHFYGGVFSFNYERGPLNLVFGGGANEYLGGHYGEVVWAEYSSNSGIRDRYYDNDANKIEAHSYLKGTYKYGRLTFYGDLQYRHIDYSFLGIDDVSGSIEAIDQTVSYDFINPKAGLMFDFNSKNNTYLSIAVANREPVRRDFRENTPENHPNFENLINLETGYRYKGYNLMVNANIYYMLYKDQLVLTGQINDVGDYTRTNVDVSYRSGIELEAGYRLSKKLSITGNLTLSNNKIEEFNEYIDNYDIGGQDTITHTNSDLAFSPNIIAAAGLRYSPVKGLNISLLGKHVGDQFLDNTSTETRKLNAYTTLNLQVNYTVKDVLFKEITFGLLVNNILDAAYENNGYTWGYIYGGERTVENFYFPQAGRNFLVRVLLNL